MDTQEVDRELSRADWVSFHVPFLTPFVSKSYPLIKTGLPKVSPETIGPSSHKRNYEDFPRISF